MWERVAGRADHEGSNTGGGSSVEWPQSREARHLVGVEGWSLGNHSEWGEARDRALESQYGELVDGGGADGEEGVELPHELAPVVDLVRVRARARVRARVRLGLGLGLGLGVRVRVVDLGERVGEGAVEEHLRVQVRDGQQRQQQQG
eukprot:scaffold97427_cov39-Phaeocystis_antarctica.AAC.1